MSAELSGNRRRTYTLEVDFHSEPITGVLTATGGEHPFVGWIGLVQALERAAGPADRAASSPPEP